MNPVKIFLLIAPLLFAAYSLLTPPFQTFDENQHLYRAWQISDFKFTAERRGSESGGELPPGPAEATLQEIGSVVPQGERRVVVRPISDIFSWNTPIGRDQPQIYYNFFGSAVYSPVGYVPQSLAVRVGEAFGLSVEWTLRLGRLINSVICIGLIWGALTLIPFGRWTMMIIALLPPTATGAASFGQDGLVIGGGFLLTAVGLKVAVEREWSASKFALVALAGIAVTMVKIVYLPLVAVAALPRPQNGIPLFRWMSAPLLIGFVAALLLFVWMRINADAVVPFRPWLPSFSEQASWILTHPTAFCALVARTYIEMLPIMWAELYALGDSTVPIVWVAALAGTSAILLTLIHGEPRAVDLTRGRRAWMLLIFSAVGLLIATALFVSYTLPNAPYINGIQARYFLPALPLAAIALMRRGGAAPVALLRTALALASIAHVATLKSIFQTFYSL